ncbi:tyrosine-type recombinase/integrase [Anatilimnocola sp. NA78]|uniref:tyrosine-type recombinase/integrase n=1 Tax=Anatilimnocola sp. NA78 TaxID=3415683 RepID=UPI003CE4C8B2
MANGYLSQKWADRTVYLELTLLKAINTWLINHKQLPSSAKIILPLKKPQGTDTYCYGSQEVTAIVNHCRADRKLIWMADLLMGLAFTGMRISELAGLRWSDVNFEKGMVRVADERSSRFKQQAGSARTTKGDDRGRSRFIPSFGPCWSA